MPNNNNINNNDLSREEQKKLLSKKGIFMIYNYQRFKKSPPFLLACIIATSYIIVSNKLTLNHEEMLKYIVEKFMSIFPNLIGFSLGGYAIIVGFGNSDFVSRISKTKVKSKYTVYEVLNAIFAFNLVCQVLALCLSIFIDFSFFVSLKANLLIPNEIAQLINCLGVSVLLFIGTWALLIIPYLVTNIFIFGQTYHVTLKRTPDGNNIQEPKQRVRNRCGIQKYR